MRNLALVCAFAFVVAGCAGGSETTESTLDPTTTTLSGDPTSTSEAETTTTTSAGETTTTSGRELAPDFTLELGEGGSYTLSEGAKPVYMVFWAEW